MSSVIIAGDVSGSVTLQAPSAAGSTVVNLPSTLGNTGTSSFATTDASGNLGLGVTPSAWSSDRKALQINRGGLYAGNSANYITLFNNVYYDGTSLKYIANGAASYYTQGTDGASAWNIAASGTAGSAISFTQAMTLDASGNLILQSGSSWGTSAGGLNLSYNSSAGLITTYYDSTSVTLGAGVSAQNNITVNGSGGSNNITFKVASSERMRIDSSGNLLVGTTSNAPSGGTAKQYNLATGTTVGLAVSVNNTGYSLVNFFYNNSSLVGSISTNGSLTSYNISSDYRLKENIVPLSNALEKITQLKPSLYNYKSDPTTNIEGFIAHELQEVVPHCVTGEKDAVDDEGNPIYQGVDASFLIPILTAAIQELATASQEQQAIITQLQADVAALKGQA